MAKLKVRSNSKVKQHWQAKILELRHKNLKKLGLKVPENAAENRRLAKEAHGY